MIDALRAQLFPAIAWLAAGGAGFVCARVLARLVGGGGAATRLAVFAGSAAVAVAAGTVLSRWLSGRGSASGDLGPLAIGTGFASALGWGVHVQIGGALAGLVAAACAPPGRGGAGVGLASLWSLGIGAAALLWLALGPGSLQAGLGAAAAAVTTAALVARPLGVGIAPREFVPIALGWALAWQLAWYASARGWLPNPNIWVGGTEELALAFLGGGIATAVGSRGAASDARARRLVAWGLGALVASAVSLFAAASIREGARRLVHYELSAGDAVCIGQALGMSLGAATAGLWSRR